MGSEVLLHLLESLEEVPTPSAAERDRIRPDVGSRAQLVSISDEKLLGSVRAGETEALGVLFRRHGRAVLNVALRILRDEAEADDIRQEVFLYLYERAGLYDSTKSSALSWIIQITYHRALDRRRFLSRRQHYQAGAFDEQQLELQDGQSHTDRIDAETILCRIKHDLTPDQQKTLELHFFEGYSFREIAELQNQTIGNIRHHYYRALERLRTCIFSGKRVENERIQNR